MNYLSNSIAHLFKSFATSCLCVAAQNAGAVQVIFDYGGAIDGVGFRQSAEYRSLASPLYYSAPEYRASVFGYPYPSYTLDMSLTSSVVAASNVISSGFSRLTYDFQVVAPGLETSLMVPVSYFGYGEASVSGPLNVSWSTLASVEYRIASNVATGQIFCQVSNSTITGGCGSESFSGTVMVPVNTMQSVQLFMVSSINHTFGPAGTTGIHTYIDPFLFIDPAFLSLYPDLLLVVDGVGNGDPRITSTVGAPASVSLIALGAMAALIASRMRYRSTRRVAV